LIGMTKLCLFVLVIGLAACKKPASTCGDVTGILIPSGSVDDSYVDRADLAHKVQNAIGDSCRNDKWPADGIECMAARRESGDGIGDILSDCATKIGPAYAALEKQLSELSAEALVKQVERARKQAAATTPEVTAD
jgi:hypothetical protein